ncbi:MAG: hypothetical protein HY680_01585 [Chloroflexi bacterium]|nr:hypothetical protein [Chloroflexota bacterium]
MPFLDEEFWWLSALGRPIEGYVGVARSWWTPREYNPGWCECSSRKSIQELWGWAQRHQLENVHRTLAVYRTIGSEADIVGPFVVDIDCDEETALANGTLPHHELAAAQAFTLRVVDHYLHTGITEEDLRVCFSGHKGFHVEVLMRKRREFLHASDLSDDNGPWRQELKALQSQVRTQKGLVIDLPHGFVRLKETWNVWTMKARCIGITIDALRTMSIADILTRANFAPHVS